MRVLRTEDRTNAEMRALRRFPEVRKSVANQLIHLLHTDLYKEVNPVYIERAGTVYAVFEQGGKGWAICKHTAITWLIGNGNIYRNEGQFIEVRNEKLADYILEHVYFNQL